MAAGIVFWIVLGLVAAGVALYFWLRSVLRARLRKWIGVRSGHLELLLTLLLHKGPDSSAVFIQSPAKDVSIQINKYVEDGASELVWTFPVEGWTSPYFDALIAAARGAGAEPATEGVRPRREPTVEVRLGRDTGRARKLILHVLRDVYRVPALDCTVTIINLPGTREIAALDGSVVGFPL